MQDKEINLDEDLSKEDLEDMKNIFSQDENEILDITLMQNPTKAKISPKKTLDVDFHQKMLKTS